SLQPGLVAASASTDATPPTSTVTSPTTGESLTVGSTVIITGTATDAGGGIVGGVEVSVDGGVTWHRATGRSSWSYTWVPSTTGAITIKSRAVDDSGNLETPSAGVTVNVTYQMVNATIWLSTTVPAVTADPGSGAIEVGVK